MSERAVRVGQVWRNVRQGWYCRVSRVTSWTVRFYRDGDTIDDWLHKREFRLRFKFVSEAAE